MLVATKTIRFDAAHILTNHKGLCKNLHGHTYRVEISATGSDANDMVVDFKELKALAEEFIVSRFDHAFMFDATSPGEREIAAVVEKHGMRTVSLPFRTTAENLAHHFFDTLAPHLTDGARLLSVRVWETQDSVATYTPEAGETF